jgi:hypothetical protein
LAGSNLMAEYGWKEIKNKNLLTPLLLNGFQNPFSSNHEQNQCSTNYYNSLRALLIDTKPNFSKIDFLIKKCELCCHYLLLTKIGFSKAIKIKGKLNHWSISIVIACKEIKISHLRYQQLLMLGVSHKYHEGLLLCFYSFQVDKISLLQIKETERSWRIWNKILHCFVN